MKNFTIKINSEEKKRISKLLEGTKFRLQQFVKKAEAYSFDATDEEAKEVLIKLKREPLMQLDYSERLAENVKVPKELVERLETFERPIDLTTDIEIVETVINKLPSIQPLDLVKFFQELKLEDAKFSYFKDELKNLFPYHPEPFAFFGSLGKARFGMGIKRNILYAGGYIRNLGENGMNYHTQISFGFSYNPVENDFFDEAMGLVRKVKELCLIKGYKDGQA